MRDTLAARGIPPLHRRPQPLARSTTSPATPPSPTARSSPTRSPATSSTRERAALEAATRPIAPLVLPTATIADGEALRIGPAPSRSAPSTSTASTASPSGSPTRRLLLAGDTLEDPITYVSEPDRLEAHLTGLDSLAALAPARILPNHGAEHRIAAGGYGPGLIDATRTYVERLLAARSDPARAALPLDAFIAEALAAGDVEYFPRLRSRPRREPRPRHRSPQPMAEHDDAPGAAPGPRPPPRHRGPPRAGRDLRRHPPRRALLGHRRTRPRPHPVDGRGRDGRRPRRLVRRHRPLPPPARHPDPAHRPPPPQPGEGGAQRRPLLRGAFPRPDNSPSACGRSRFPPRRRWLAHPGNALALARQLTAVLGTLVRAEPSPRVIARARGWLRAGVANAGADAAIAEAIARLVKAGARSSARRRGADPRRRAVDDNRANAVALVSERSRWWIAKPVDRRVAGLAVDGVLSLLDELRTTDSPLRRDFEAAVDGAIDTLATNGNLTRAVAEARAHLVRSGTLETLALRLADTLRDRLAPASTATPTRCATPLAETLADLARRLDADPGGPRRPRRPPAADPRPRRRRPPPGARRLCRRRHRRAGNPTSSSPASRPKLGPDLQYIRINGALLGAVIGGVLYGLGLLLG